MANNQKDTEDIENEKAFLLGRNRRHCFTWFNYTDEDILRISSFTAKDCNYICWGYEICPTSGKKHLQGYVEWDKGISGANMLKKLLGRSKLSPCPINGNLPEKCRLANIRYCQKADTADPDYPVKFIEIIHKANEQGKRNDIFNELVEYIEDGKKLPEIARKFPEQAVKYTSGIKKLVEAFGDEDALKENQAMFNKWNPRIWQKELIEELSIPSTNDRNIIWYADEVGGRGKTKLADYCELFLDAEILENGPTKDVVHGWQMKPIVIFDFSRSQVEHINYGVIESIKNNRAFSGKYDSRTKRGRGCNHVVVFANWPPDASKMSADRFIIRRLTDADCLPYVAPIVDNTVEGHPVIVVPTEKKDDLFDNIPEISDEAYLEYLEFSGALREATDKLPPIDVFEQLNNI